jgi:hypothetical protein
MTERRQGGCYCGAIRFACTTVQFTLMCHCSICRRLQSSADGACVSYVPVDDYEVTQGADQLTEYLSPKNYSRSFCKTCGTRVTISFEKSDVELPYVGVYTTLLDEVKDGGSPLSAELAPQVHCFYENRLRNVLDGKPKFADFPDDFGGSGKVFDDHGAVIKPANAG